MSPNKSASLRNPRQRDLNYTPIRSKSATHPWGYALCSSTTSLRVAIGARLACASKRRKSRKISPSPRKKKNTARSNEHAVFLAEGVKRKLNAPSPALDDLELVEFDPPDRF